MQSVYQSSTLYILWISDLLSGLAFLLKIRVLGFKVWPSACSHSSLQRITSKDHATKAKSSTEETEKLENNKETELLQWSAVLEIYPGIFSLDLLIVSSINKYKSWIESIICIHIKGRKEYVVLKHTKRAMIP